MGKRTHGGNRAPRRDRPEAEPTMREMTRGVASRALPRKPKLRVPIWQQRAELGGAPRGLGPCAPPKKCPRSRKRRRRSCRRRRRSCRRRRRRARSRPRRPVATRAAGRRCTSLERRRPRPLRSFSCSARAAASAEPKRARARSRRRATRKSTSSTTMASRGRGRGGRGRTRRCTHASSAARSARAADSSMRRRSTSTRGTRRCGCASSCPRPGGRGFA